ncbi:MAG: phosphatase PAP2 family protein [Acidimicrobiia bacterium]|nr:phosphatase PAP2 family protein [Acidimicrobiia bacterium]
MDTLLDRGIDLVLWFQQFSPGLDTLFKAFTFLGDEEFYLILLPLVYWSVDRATGVRLMIVTLSSSLVNTVAKTLGGQPRPFTYDDRVVRLVDASGYGLPSGHTQSAVVVWGFIATETRRRWVWFLAGLLTLGVGLSRIYLGVHFPTDILGGFILGMLVLFVWLKYGRRAEAWFCRLPLNRQLALTAALPLMAMIAAPTDDVVTAGGTFIGMGFGVILERRSLRFATAGPVISRVGRFVVGGFVLVVLWWGLRTVLNGLEPALVFRLLRYAVVGFWGAYGAPWLFIKSGLARRELARVSPDSGL